MKNIDWVKTLCWLVLFGFIYVWWAGAYHLAFCQVITNQLQVYSPPPPPAPIYVSPAPVYGGDTYVDNNTTVIINNQNINTNGR